jgi:CRP-like cAMP-binding protein
MTETPATLPCEDESLQGIEQMLQGLAPETVRALRQTVRVHTLPANHVILSEGDQTDTLYLIEQGTVDVYRNLDGGEERVLATLTAGKSLGEMALLDGEARSASARTTSECRLAELCPNDILALPGGDRVLADIRARLAVAVTKRMRTQTDKYVAAVEREMTAIKERQHFGQFFIYTLGLMTIGLVVNDVLAKDILKIDIFTPTFAWIYLMVIVLPTSVVIWRMKIPLESLGLTRRGIKKSLIEGSLFSVVAMVLAFGFAAVMNGLGIKLGTPVPPEWGGTSAYLVHSILQELIARGLLQSSFQRFLDDRKGLQSVVLASVLFGVFHIHFGLMAVVTTILSGLVFGLVYLRHRNIAGVSLLHFFVGGAAFWAGLI